MVFNATFNNNSVI